MWSNGKNVLLSLLLGSTLASSSPITTRQTSEPTPQQEFRGVLIAQNATIDWPGLLQDNISWALVEATRGNTANADFGKWWQLATNTTGFLRGAYHIAEPSMTASNGSNSASDDATAQAKLFVQQSTSISTSINGTTFPATLRIGLDAPLDGKDKCFGLTPQDLTAWIAQWIATYKALTGQAHVAINMNAGWWGECTGDATDFSHDNILFYRSFGQEPHGGLGGWMQAPAIGNGQVDRGGDLYLWDQGFNIDIHAWAQGNIAPPPGGEF